MLLKIENATERSDAASLCTSCDHSWIRTDGKGEHRFCKATYEHIVPVYGKVTQCNFYDDKRVVKDYAMEKIAWMVNSDRHGKILGFTPPVKEG